MIRLLPIIMLAVLAVACSGSSEEKANESPQMQVEKPETISKVQDGEQKKDQYTFVLKHLDNRVVLYINDSIIFDSGEVPGGPYEREIDLSEYVADKKTNLKVELYNTNPPTESIRPGWMIVYDIFVNEELVEFISEKKNESTIGVVYTETYDLNDLW